MRDSLCYCCCVGRKEGGLGAGKEEGENGEKGGGKEWVEALEWR